MQPTPISEKTRLIALCRHELPSGPPHIDLFVGPEGAAGDEDRVVRTWRLSADPMNLDEGGSNALIPLPLHRGRYLGLKGPVRPRSVEGTVTPLRNGQCTLLQTADRPDLLTVRWADGSGGCFELHHDRIVRLPMTGPCK